MRITRIIALFSAGFLFLLAFYHLRFRDIFLVKVGMSHLFSPAMVGVLSYLIPAINIVGAILMLYWDYKRASVFFALVIFSFYTAYNSILYLKTGSECGCANLFIDIDLRKQIAAGCLMLFLNFYLLLAFRKKESIVISGKR